MCIQLANRTFKQVYRADVERYELSRILDHRHARHRPYRTDMDAQWKTACHFGQRKLLMSEIEFLTMHARRHDTVVYAGAAPGTHIPLLVWMFRSLELTFVLVDPVLDTDVTWEGCVKYKSLFELNGDGPTYASYWKDKPNVLFISDVRSKEGGDEDTPTNEDVVRDMAMQREWVDLMRPRAGMLKFRLPWVPKNRKTGKRPPTIVEYIAGDIHLPVWGPPRTTETRLVFTRDQEGVKEYDAIRYEDEMYHFNTVTRMSRYPRLTAGCQCYDCAAEATILRNYVKLFEPREVERLWVRVDGWRDRITAHNPNQDPYFCSNEGPNKKKQRL